MELGKLGTRTVIFLEQNEFQAIMACIGFAMDDAPDDITEVMTSIMDELNERLGELNAKS